ncbi:hypothetical protein SAMD00023520_02248 [Listeria monocytogenes]|nr:hypothetical protein SAMD00023520_02248 [Listeria monocytogenes]
MVSIPYSFASFAISGGSIFPAPIFTPKASLLAIPFKSIVLSIKDLPLFVLIKR